MFDPKLARFAEMFWDFCAENLHCALNARGCCDSMKNVQHNPLAVVS